MHTSLESLSCNNCGAPLNVPHSANFVTCNHCRTQLAIRRTPTASYTERLAEMSRKTEELTEQVKHLACQNELAAIDRDWEREKERHMITGKHGHKRLPNPTLALIAGGALALLGGGLLVIGATSGSPQMLLMGFAVGAVGLFAGIHEHTKAGDYRAALARYRRRRASVTPESVNLDRHTPRDFTGAAHIPTPDEYLRELERADSGG